MLRTLLIFLILNSIAFGTTGQKHRYRFHSYGTDHGLPSESINALAEDNYGFIWIGTTAGLCRYDAHQFKALPIKDNNLNTSASNDIITLHFDANNNLWIGTEIGLFYMDYKTERFTNVWKELGLNPEHISKIISDELGNIWIGTEKGLYQYTPSNKALKHFKHDPAESTSISSNEVFDLIIDSKDRLWISTLTGGLNLYDPTTNSFHAFKHDPHDQNSISSNTLRELAEMPDGRIAIGTSSSGFNILDTHGLTFQRFNYDPLDDDTIVGTSAYSFLVDNNDMLWIGTWANGLSIFNPNTNKAKRYINNPDDVNSLPGNTIKTILQSSNGDIWLGTFKGGLGRLNPKEQTITRYLHDSQDDNSLSSNYIRSVYEEPSGILWIGTGQTGLQKYNPETGEFTKYLESDGSRDAMARGSIWSISPGNDGKTLWLGTSRGIGKMNRESGEITFYEPNENDPDAIVGNNVLKVLDDHNGTLWAGLWYGGLNRMDISTGKFEHFFHTDNDSSTIASNNVNEIFIDSKKRVWIGTDVSLSLYQPETKSFINYPYNTLMINEDNDGHIWFTSPQGFCKFDPDSVSFSFFSSKDGLADNNIASVLIDSNGTIWAGTNSHGIDRFNPRNGDILHIAKSDGLAGNNNMSRACYLGSSGKIYFGGVDGLSEIDPNILSNITPPPSVQFTNFLLFNKSVNIADTSVLKQSIQTTEHITLSYEDYIFAFEFAALDFQHTREITYHYKLEGFDKDWITTGIDNRKAVYTNVPQGDYTLKVKANFAHSPSFSEEVSMMITIVPPWWNTWWANTLFYVVLLLLGVSLFKLRLSAINRQKKALEKEVAIRTNEVTQQKEELQTQAERLKELNNQKNKLLSIVAHDLRNPLASLHGITSLLDPKILSDTELEKLKTSLTEQINGLQSNMENLLNWAVGQMEGEVMRTEHFDIGEVCAEMMDLYQANAVKKGIILKNNVPPNNQIFADKDQVRVILRNLVTNALKFTESDGIVQLSHKIDNGHIIISVSDSGHGMSKAKLETLFSIQTNTSTRGTSGEKGVGLGLLLVKEFVEKNNGKIWVGSEEGKGTTFNFELPMMISPK